MKWICLIALCSSGPAWPQAASNDGDSAGVAFPNYIHVVNNMDKTLAFYHDVFELDIPAQLLPNPSIPALVNSPGSRLRHALLQLPNTCFSLKLPEFSGAVR